MLSKMGNKIKSMMVDVSKKKNLSRKGSLARGSSFRVYEKTQNNIQELKIGFTKKESNKQVALTTGRRGPMKRSPKSSFNTLDPLMEGLSALKRDESFEVVDELDNDDSPDIHKRGRKFDFNQTYD